MLPASTTSTSVGGAVEIGQLDRRTERADRRDGRRRGLRRPGDPSPCRRRSPARPPAGSSPRPRPCRRRHERLLHHVADQRHRDLEPLHRGLRAEADLPAERLLAGRDARTALGELLSMPRAMRGSSQAFMLAPFVMRGAGPRMPRPLAPSRGSSRRPAMRLTTCGSPDRPRSPRPRSSRRPSSPTPARRPRSRCC